MLNIVTATFDALTRLKTPQQVAIERGKNVEDVSPFWARRKNG